MDAVRERIPTKQPPSQGFRFWAVWNLLTIPPAEMENPEQRRRARFLLTLNVIVIPLGVLGMMASELYGGGGAKGGNIFNPVNLVGYGHLFLLIIGYLLGRSAKYYTAGALITLMVISSGALFTSLYSPQDADTLLVWIIFAVFTASLLLSLQHTIIVAVVNNLVIFLLPIFSDAITFRVVLDIWLFIFIMSILIIIAASIRKRDLRYIEEQAQTLSDSLQRLENANRLKSQFLATMSHELRTPLNAIIGFTEVMMMGLAGELDPKAQHTTQRIHHNGQRLLSLIDDLLDISKIEAGRIEIIYQPFEPAILVQNVERTMKLQAEKKGLTFTCTLDPALPATMRGDMQRLEQIIYNLVGNAIKFTEKGEVKLSLKSSDEATWCIEVSDTGIGIASHAQEYIFDKFRQVDGTTSRAYKGVGLGLAIVKELALLMGGKVKVKSELGAGSTFTVSLPLLKEEAA